MIIIAVIFPMAAVTVVPATAATLTSVSDAATSQDVSGGSNHTLLFTTSSGVSEGDAMTITFDASFDTSSLVEDDIDVLDDGAQLTTAADCSGAEEASVSIASDVVTITICAGDGGAIAGGSVVTIEVGTQATSSGTGSNAVTNPSVPGTFSISIGGSFGDVGNVWLPIVSTGDVPVSALVLGGGGGGGAGDTGGDTGEEGGDGETGEDETCGDLVAPILSSIQVTSVTSTSALVSWVTDELSSTTVHYGPTTAYGVSIIGGVTDYHGVTLSGLTAGTVYHFRVRSADTCGNESISEDYTFTTLDLVPPTISGIVVDSITMTSAVVSWQTNKDTTGDVSLFIATSPVGTFADAVSAKAHQVTLTGLTPATNYRFTIEAVDALGNRVTSSSQSFTTLADLPPGNVIGLTVTPGNATNRLSWTLPGDTDLVEVIVVWRTDRFPASVSDGSVIRPGLVSTYRHDGLTNGVTYYYGVFLRDRAGNLSSGALASGTPVAPPVIDDVDPTDDTEDTDDTDDEPVLDDGRDEDTSDDGDILDDGRDGDSSGDDTSGDEASLDEADSDEDTSLGDGEADVIIGADGSVCGNRICEEGETALSCPLDCSVELVEPHVTAGGAVVGVRHLVSLDRIELFPLAGVVSVLPSRPLRLTVEADGVPESGVLQVVLGGSRYLLTREEGVFTGIVTTPAGVGRTTLSVESVVGDETYLLMTEQLQLEPFGFVFESIEGERERLGYARVTLLLQSGGTFLPWESAEYGQLNPQTTPLDGTFAWYVPQGTYVLSAQVDGYRSTQTAPRFVTNAIVAEPIELRREPPSIIDVITASEPLLTKLGMVTEVLSERTTELLQVVREQPAVQLGVNVATPTLVATSVASTVVLSFSFNLLPFLQYLFTSPVLLLWRRRRNRWGVVYDAVSKQPIDLAIVRLYRLTDGRVVQSRVTDRNGRYYFLVDPGEYRIGVTKAGFGFPSELLRGLRQDGGLVDLYHGESVEVTDEQAVIAANIPLDPISTGAQHLPLQIRAKRVLRTVQHLLGSAGVIVALVVLVVQPTFLTAVVFGVQALVYVFVRRLARPSRKPDGWGIVYDESTRKPIANAVVRIFEPVYNKLLATAVTDGKGRYTFLVGPSEYYARVEKSGYEQKEIRPIDLTDQKEPTDITLRVGLHKDSPKKTTS